MPATLISMPGHSDRGRNRTVGGQKTTRVCLYSSHSCEGQHLSRLSRTRRNNLSSGLSPDMPHDTDYPYPIRILAILK